MGVLTAAGDRGGEAPSNDNGGGSILEPPDTAPEPAAPEKPTFVPLADVEKQGRTPGSRRQKAEAEIEARMQRVADAALAKQREEYEKRLSTYEQTVAEMRGMVNAGMQRFNQPPPQQIAPPQESPEDLIREAKKNLDAGNFSEYERLKDKAYDVRLQQTVAREREAVLQEVTKRIPQQIPPFISTLIAKHDNVAMAGDRGLNAVMLKDQELALYNVPQGPERLKKAFELADQMLGGQSKPTPPQFSRDSAASLAAVPTTRPAGGGGSGEEPGVNLTPLQTQAAKNAGMTPAEYVKWMNPDKYVKPRW